MSKELKKLYKTALVSINYFFLKIAFKDTKKHTLLDNHVYESLKKELSTLLETLEKENLKEEVSTLFKSELYNNEHTRNKTKPELIYGFKLALNEIFGTDQPELFEFYASLL